MPEAEVGVIKLVQELEDFIYHTNALSKFDNKPWKVIIASGTGTMALFVARHLALNNAIRKENGISSPALTQTQQGNQHIPANLGPSIDIGVIAIPCVGSSGDLQEQMEALDNVSGIQKIFPTILPHRRDYKNFTDCINNDKENSNISVTAKSNPISPENKHLKVNMSQNEIDKNNLNKSKRIFGNPSKVHYEIWADLIKETGVTFDLIYTPMAMEILFESFEYDKSLWNDCNLLYYHCGGVEGNESQLGRYKYAKLI
jgi:1-aminocyclopropane-1-carboxylate deaminase/D-cysteine desulfhydrase-like pyridoxal-dependent ACC family enzyme